MTRQDAIAAVLCHTWLAAVVPAYFHHFAPLACWITAWGVLLIARERA